MSLIEKSVDGQNCVVRLYARATEWTKMASVQLEKQKKIQEADIKLHNFKLVS